MVLADMEATVLVLPAMEVTVLDTVSGRDLLMPKPGAPLDTDTAPDMVLADMEVTVLALPAMEVTVLDTVSGRDLLMPDTVDTDVEAMVDTAVDMEVMVDADTVDTVERDLLMPGTDVDTVDTEDMDTVERDLLMPGTDVDTV